MALTWPNDGALVIRTDFAHPAEWRAVRDLILEPQTPQGFLPTVEFVDNRGYEGLTVPQLLALAPQDAVLAFLVDTETLTHPERPILAVDLHERNGGTFRVIPSEMWGVENNLTLANMDWEEFADAVDEDGIFRGFPG